MKNIDANKTPALFGTERPSSLHERIYKSLFHAIASGRFGIGTRLPAENELAATFGVSRPVVRQAIQLLRSDGLVESRRGSGNHVLSALRQGQQGSRVAYNSMVVKRQIMDELEFRHVIEPEAAFLAARRRVAADLSRMEDALEKFEAAHRSGTNTHLFDYMFHEAIASSTTNQRFVNALRSLEFESEEESAIRHYAYYRPGIGGDALIQEHRNVFQFIKDREAEEARRAMAMHIEGARLRLRDLDLSHFASLA